METTPELKEELNRLITGVQVSTTSCLNVDYESKREEDFKFILLQVEGKKDLYESFD